MRFCFTLPLKDGATQHLLSCPAMRTCQETISNWSMLHILILPTGTSTHCHCCSLSTHTLKLICVPCAGVHRWAASVCGAASHLRLERRLLRHHAGRSGAVRPHCQSGRGQGRHQDLRQDHHGAAGHSCLAIPSLRDAGKPQCNSQGHACYTMPVRSTAGRWACAKVAARSAALAAHASVSGSVGYALAFFGLQPPARTPHSDPSSRLLPFPPIRQQPAR